MECSVRLGVASCVYQLVRASLLQKLLRSQSSTAAFNYIMFLFSGHAANLTCCLVISYFSSYKLCWITVSISIVLSNS
jgi:hypothetical protein